MIEMSVVLGFCAIFLAAVVQGLTGFGFALVAVPLLSILIPLQSVVPIVLLLGFVVNIMIFIKIWAHIKFKEIWILFIFGVILTPVGAYLLVIVNETILKVVIGVLTLLFSFSLWKGYKLKIRHERVALITVGSASGLLNGSLGLVGLPVAIFLTNKNEDKTSFRANIAFFSFSLSILGIINFLFLGLIDREVIEYSAWFLLALVIGAIVGVKIERFINQELFKKVTILIIMLAGLSTLISMI